MHRLEHMKETLISCVQSQLADIHNVDTHELGEAIDMIKDLEEAIYYCSLNEESTHAVDRDMDKESYGRMYYPYRKEPWKRPLREKDRERYDDNTIYYDEKELPMELRDVREGRSPMTRRNYMEYKELHKDKDTKIRELDKYMKELSEDLVEMIQDSTPEEKQLLEKKLSALTAKISSLNHA